MTKQRIVSRRRFEGAGNLLFSDGFHVCIDGGYFIREENAAFYLPHELVAWANANRSISETVFEGKSVQKSDQFILDSIERTVKERRKRSMTNSVNARQPRKSAETRDSVLQAAKEIREKYPNLKIGRVAAKVADRISEKGEDGICARTVERWIRPLWATGRID